MYICMCILTVCSYNVMWVCTYIRIYIHIYIYTVYIYIYIYIYIYVCVCMHIISVIECVLCFFVDIQTKEEMG